LELHTDTVQNIPVFVSPSNFANFRLGPIDGSACDTLGINSVKEFEKSTADISVYPNPAKDVLNIRLLNTIPKKPNIHIFNSQGSKVFGEPFSNVLHTIHLSELNIAKGLYWIRVINGNESYLKRFIIE